MKPNNTTQITDADLNGIDAMNGTGSVDNDNYTTWNLKGSLSPLSRNGYGLSAIMEERNFVETTRQQIVEFKAEQFDYKNLPEGLDKYRIERKLIENGKGALVKYNDDFYFVNYVVITWNMYNEPMDISVIEPRSSMLHNRKYNVYTDDIAIIRDNLATTPFFNRVSRQIKAMEKTLFQIEKNLTSSAPKGIINMGNNEWEEEFDHTNATSMESIVNGQNTFYQLKSKGKDASVFNDGDELFTPIELTDRTDNLWKNYLNLKEQVKELIGSYTNGNIAKKERTITNEIDGQQELGLATWKHCFNIRKNDIEKANEVLGLDIIIELVKDQEEHDTIDTDNNTGEGE